MNHPKYDQDFYEWTLQSAELLRQKNFEKLDWENLAEEIENMGKRDRRELRFALTHLILYLLKWQFQRGGQGSDWRMIVLHRRAEIRLILQDSPGLKSRLAQTLEDIYSDVLAQAPLEIGFHKSRFPAKCPYSLEQCLDDQFLPE